MPAVSLTLNPTDLLVYLDETGGETMSDPEYPIFGIGGCAVTGDKYLEAIERPWKDLKTRYFGSVDQPLHASQIDTSNKIGIRALGDFFRRNTFARFATVFTKETQIEPPQTSRYLAISLVIRQQLERLIKASSFYRLVLVFESSSRGNPFVREHFSDIVPVLDMPGGPQRAPVERCFMSKGLCHAPLEVADFVLHAAGCQALGMVKRRGLFRKDFETVFEPAPGRFAEIAIVGHVSVKPRRGRT